MSSESKVFLVERVLRIFIYMCTQCVRSLSPYITHAGLYKILSLLTSPFLTGKYLIQ